MVGAYVRGVRGNVRESTLGSNGDDGSLELLGGHLGNGKGRVLGGRQGDVVGQETGNVGGGHGGSGDGVDGVLAASPGGQDVQTRSEDISALSVVGEVSTLVSQGRSTNSDGLLGSGGGVIASISVVVTGSDSEVKTSVDSSVDSEIQSAGGTTAKGHVGNATLELLVTLLGLLDVRLSGPLNTLDHIGHGAGAVGAEDLDGVDVGLLGNTVLLTGDGTGAVGSVTVSILIGITLRDGLTPGGTALEVNVLNVGTGVDHVGIDTLTTLLGVEVLVEVTEGEGITVRDTGKTPGSVLLNGTLTHGADLRVPLDIFDL